MSEKTCKETVRSRRKLKAGECCKLPRNEQAYADLLSHIIDAGPCVAARFDSSSRCLFISKGWQDVFGVTADQPVGRTLSEMLGCPESEHPCTSAMKRALGEGIRVETTYVKAVPGGHKTYFMAISPEKFEPRGSAYVDVVLVDISQCLQKFSQQQDTLVSRERFIGIVAHELRNPLSAIASGLKILTVSPDGMETVKVRQMMERQLGHLSRLVHDLLDMSRISEARLTLSKSNVLLSEVVSLAIETAQSSIKKGEHVLQVSLPDEPIELFVDGSRIAQVVSNLLDNSSKYTPSRGIINLHVACVEGEMEISVKDNGLGIAPSHRDSIFRQYMQVDGSNPRARGGLGLGLYLVKMIVEAHGGSIKVCSDGEGKGSEFVVKLPLQ